MLTGHESEWGYLVVWEFIAKPGGQGRFEELYGSGGEWSRLFCQSDGYITTELNCDPENPRRYLTLDFWRCRETYDEFRTRHAPQYADLDRECEEVTESERDLGRFERVRG
jgi:hypothetical protein